MTSLVLFQTVINILLFAFTGLIWSRLRHLTGDEGRLKQGLQILQTKIAILEDLGRQVDEQSQQTLQLLELKKKSIENLIVDAQKTVTELSEKTAIVTADSESLIERDTSLKFTRAAIMASRGMSPREISLNAQIGLQEAELIHSLNSQQLQFKVDELPKWMLPHIQDDLL